MKRCLHVLMGCLLASLSNQILADGGGSTAAEGQLPTPRIVNGEDISITAAPSSVALISESVYRRTGSLRSSQFCGATLITERWLLTAAHCLVLADGFTRDVTSLLALAGTTDLDNPVTDPIAIDSMVIHPNYRSVESGFDIALLRLADPTNSTFSGIDTDPVSFNEAALIVGWGTLKSQEEGEQALLSPVLQGATVFMVPGSVCDATFPEQRRETGVAIDNRQICAAVPGGGTDSCQGDSGGALYRISAGGELGLVGVVSYGVGCGLDGYPGVYTNIGSADNRSFVVTTVNDNPTVTTSTQVVPPDDDVEDPEVEIADVFPPLPGAGAPLLLLPVIGLAVLLRRKTKRMV